MTAILTHYIPASETRPTRIKAKAGNGASSITLSRGRAEEIAEQIPRVNGENREEHTHRIVAIAFCDKMGWTGTMVCGGTRNGFAFVFTD